ncbi:MAG: hypothetical protein Q8J89_03195 [Caulobacter sp.]|nr:hypothetical protein [Caulobacter sp.]
MTTPRNWTVAADYSATTFEGVAVSLFELYRNRLAAGQQVIEGVTFNDCLIEGPSVALVIDGCTFNNVSFGASGGDMRNVVLHPASPTSVTGAIPVQGCRFDTVQFFGVGFTGNPDFLQQLLGLGTPQ